MNILILSDTHQNMDFVSIMVHRAQSYDLVIHLGDDYKDAQPFIDASIPLIRVPGTWTSEYQHVMIENRRFEDFLGWKFFLTHTPNSDPRDLLDDVDPASVIRDQQVDIFCHGHTHQPMISQQNGVIVLNPGHLTAAEDRGYRASYAILQLTNQDCQIQIVDFELETTVDSYHLKKN